MTSLYSEFFARYSLCLVGVGLFGLCSMQPITSIMMSSWNMICRREGRGGRGGEGRRRAERGRERDDIGKGGTPINN